VQAAAADAAAVGAAVMSGELERSRRIVVRLGKVMMAICLYETYFKNSFPFSYNK
jgi:hypothetical protein